MGDRHLIDGRGGTVLASNTVVVIVDEPPDSDVVRHCERLLFGSGDSSEGHPLGDARDLIARLLDTAGERSPSLAVAAATERGITLAASGAATVTLDGAPASFGDRVPDGGDGGDGGDGDGLRLSSVGTGASIVLAVPGVDAPGGQWVTAGVVGGSSVTVGSLTAASAHRRVVDVAAASTPPGPSPARTLGDLGGGAADIDFGSLIGSHSSGGESGAVDDRSTLAADDGAVTPRTEPTAAYSPVAGEPLDQAEPPVPTLLFSGSGSGSGGRRVMLDAPVVVGRRPPDDLVDEVMPHLVQIEDRKLSRHHATFQLIDGRVTVADRGSTNGTVVCLPDGRRERCAEDRLVEVPSGATVDIGGVVIVTVERGALRSDEAPC